MSEQVNENTHFNIEDTFVKNLNGDRLENAQKLFAFLKANNVMPEKIDGDCWNYRNNGMFVIHAYENDNNNWFMYGHIATWENYPINDDMKDFIWENIRICTGQCGCPNWPRGGNQIVFGKKFESVCSSVFMFQNPDAETLEKIKELVLLAKNNIDNSQGVFEKIEVEAKKYLKDDNLKVAMDLLAYLKESGRTWILSEHHPEFYYMGEMTCLIAYDKGHFNLNDFREIIESAGNRFVYDPSSNWNICCWQHEDDIYELDSFPVDEDVKEYARANVWKCIRCHADGSCGTFGGGHRTVFGKEFDNACCNVFQLANPDEKELGYIKKLMELEKHIIAERKNK